MLNGDWQNEWLIREKAVCAAAAAPEYLEALAESSNHWLSLLLWLPVMPSAADFKRAFGLTNGSEVGKFWWPAAVWGTR